MTFKQIAENLRTTGRKFYWGQQWLVSWQDVTPAYCALGIKASEFGVSNLILAYAQSNNDIAHYDQFGLCPVYLANDRAFHYENLLERLEVLEENKGLRQPDIEGWVNYLKTLEPAARQWATENGFKSLLA